MRNSNYLSYQMFRLMIISFILTMKFNQINKIIIFPNINKNTNKIKIHKNRNICSRIEMIYKEIYSIIIVIFPTYTKLVKFVTNKSLKKYLR